jgi:hypothetical protein
MPRFLKWFCLFFRSDRTRAGKSRRPSVRPCLETLGERLVPSFSPSSSFQRLCQQSFEHVQFMNSVGGSDGTLVITSAAATGGFQGLYFNPHLAIEFLPVQGTMSASAIHFDGTRTKFLSNNRFHGKDVQSVTFDGTLSHNGPVLSTTGDLRASDLRTASFSVQSGPGTPLNPGRSGPQSLFFGAVGIPDAGLAQQGRFPPGLLSEVNDQVSGTFTDVVC